MRTNTVHCLNKALKARGDQAKSDRLLEELAGNLFRVTQTAARIKSKNVSGLNSLQRTAQDVGSEVRRIMIQNSGTAPEHLAIEEDVQGVQKRLKKVDREMKKLDKPKAKKKP